MGFVTLYNVGEGLLTFPRRRRVDLGEGLSATLVPSAAVGCVAGRFTM
jgi:hypothetical protein